MAMFQKADLSKPKYIVALVQAVNSKKPVKLKSGKSVIFKKTDDINKLEKVQNEPTKYMKILYPKNQHAAIFTDGKQYYKFTEIDKSPFSGMGGSRNALGKKLADAGELATVMSLTKVIKNPKDTGQKLFEDNPQAFADWKDTFDYTKVAVKKIVGSVNSYNILHDATDKSKFKHVIDDFCKKIKIAKDSWNPADIFMISKQHQSKIENELRSIVDQYDLNTNLTDLFNTKIYEYYTNKWLYPISLKQLTGRPSIELTNVPGKKVSKHYNIVIERFNVDMEPVGKEVGLFVFKNLDTKKTINMQVRGFPHGYTTAQSEITSDGSPTGGRLGKISTKIVDRILSMYNFERIKSINYFGKGPKYFSAFDDKRIKEVFDTYKRVTKHSKVNNKKDIKLAEFKDLINTAKNDSEVAAVMCQKIQGLVMMDFFIANEKEVSKIMNSMINGAKKIGDENGFFIKIY